MTIEVKKDWVGKKASEVKVQPYKNESSAGDSRYTKCQAITGQQDLRISRKGCRCSE